MNDRTFYLVIIILMILITIATGIYLDKTPLDCAAECPVTEEMLDQYKMYLDKEGRAKASRMATNGLLGLAYGDYIVVWTRNRTILEVLETCTHEYAHNNLDLCDWDGKAVHCVNNYTEIRRDE